MYHVARGAMIAVFFAAGLGAYAVSVRDSMNRPVSLQAEARRVVSLSPSATETLFGIGAGDLVVGDTFYCDWPPQAARVEKVGGYSAQSISMEKILDLRPDLVVSSGSIHATVRKALESRGIPVYVYEPETVEETFKVMEDLGTLTGRSNDAERLVQELRAGLARIARILSGVPEPSRARVFWEINPEPLITCGSESYLNDLILRAGGVNVFGDLAASWPVVSSEEAVLRAPQVILAADDYGPGLSREAFAKRPGWSSMPAVRLGRIYFLAADPVSRAGPRIVEGVRSIAAVLYPELFR